MAGRRGWMLAPVLGVLALTGAAACQDAGLSLGCSVEGAGRLATAIAPQDICQAVARSFAEETGLRVTLDPTAGPGHAGAWAQVALTVTGPDGISARLRHGRGGAARDLAPMEFSIMDRSLDLRQIGGFARVLARQMDSD